MSWLTILLGIKSPKIIKTISWADYDAKEEIMTVTYDNGTQAKYYGSCTVWHSYPLMERCSTATESKLCEIWTYIKKFGNCYPDSHKKTKL